MNPFFDTSIVALLVGGALLFAIAAKVILERINVPPLVGFILIGFLLSLLNTYVTWPERSLINRRAEDVFSFLGHIGVVILLFRVGLDSRIRELLGKLGEAAPIWVGNVVLTAVATFLVARWWMQIDLIPSLALAAALTATSVGVPAAVWARMQALDTGPGEVFIDVAELDDISGVVLMGLLFSALPALQQGEQDLWPLLGWSVLTYIGLLAAFALGCYLFARFVAPRMHDALRSCRQPDPLVIVAGVAIVVASIAGLLGFSLAVGAFFAGLIFSNETLAKPDTASFRTLYDWLVPFFFIRVGMHLEFTGGGEMLGLAGLIFVLAVVTKFLGTAGPARLRRTWPVATVLGISMIPRAEIAMVVMERTLNQGLISQRLFSATVLAAVLTSLLGAVALAYLIPRYVQAPQKQEASR